MTNMRYVWKRMFRKPNFQEKRCFRYNKSISRPFWSILSPICLHCTVHSCAAICLVQHYTRLSANTMQYTAKLCLYQFSSERTVHSAAAIWRARQCTRLSSGNWRLSPPPVSSTLHTAPASRPPDRSFPAIFLTSRFSIHSPLYFCRLELLDFCRTHRVPTYPWYFLLLLLLLGR